MDELDIFDRMSTIELESQLILENGSNARLARKIAEHRQWLKSIRHERPSPEKHYKVAVYIRYFNQTNYENYLNYHMQHFSEAIALCPNWEFVGFYVDEGNNAPNMENSKEWSRLLNDCMDGKADLIITQKVSNVSKRPYEITICSRLLAAQTPPIGIYFISEDIFTLSSYYLEDLRDFDSYAPADQLETDERGLLND